MVAPLARYEKYIAVKRVRGDAGELAIYNPAHATGLIVMTGRMEQEHAEAIIAVAEQMMMRQEGAHVAFHDYSQTTGFASSARQTLTAWGRGVRDRVNTVHVLTSGKLVAMGVATTGLALTLVGTRLLSYSNPDRFMAAVEQQIERARGA